MTPDEFNALLERIAAEHLHIDTLDERHSDALDLYDIAVWEIRTALIAAFEAGREAERGDSD